MKGGKRPGASRKKWIPNRASAPRQAAIAASGLPPLECMLVTMRDASKPLSVRLDMAKAAAPYVHSRLTLVEQTGEAELAASFTAYVNFVDPDSRPDRPMVP